MTSCEFSLVNFFSSELRAPFTALVAPAATVVSRLLKGSSPPLLCEAKVMSSNEDNSLPRWRRPRAVGPSAHLTSLPC